MRPRHLLPLAVAILAGCGGPSTAPESHNAKLGPHSGPVVALPGDRGFAEIVLETATGKQAGLEARVAAYFLKSDLVTPLADKPTDVSAKLQLPSDEGVDLPLTPESDPKDPSAARYASKPGPYAIDQLMGELSGKLGGESFNLPFATAR